MLYEIVAGALVEGQTNRLNPCSNGICSMSFAELLNNPSLLTCLNPCSNGICSMRQRHQSFYSQSKRVLILVLMEYALERVCLCLKVKRTSLNPCSNGICSMSLTIICSLYSACLVLILVLMEYAL